MPRFVNRVEELSRLRELYDSDEAELAVIYGRRRRGCDRRRRPTDRPRRTAARLVGIVAESAVRGTVRRLGPKEGSTPTNY